MAPRSSQQRRTLGPQEHIYELGVAGRKTGITLKDTGIRDEHGMEPLDALFSSPSKPDKSTHADEEEEEDESDDNDTGEAMDITTTSGIGPAALLNGHGNRLPMPLPRSRSPVKTSLNSPAQRNRLLARNHSSPPEDPTSQIAIPKRRLDFKSLGANGPRANSQPILGKGIPKLTAVNGSARGLTNGYHSQPTYRQEESEEEEEEEAEEDQPAEEQPNWDDNGGGDEVGDFVEESMAMLSQNDASPEPEPEQDAGESSAEEETAQAAAARRKPGRAKPLKPSPVAKATKNRRVMEEEESDHAGEEESAPEEEEPEEEEVVRKPKGRPAKPKAPPAQEPNPRSKKRRSLTADEDAEDDATGRQKKRQRADSASPPAPAAKPRGRPPKKTAPTISEELEQPSSASASKKAAGKAKAPVAPKAEKEKGKRGRKRKSSLPGDTSIVNIPRGPPLPKARGLLINRREVPGDSSSMTQTRSGRNSFKPLAYWRNERVDYDPEEETTDAFVGKSNSRFGKFLLPSIKEVVRVDEPEPVYPTKSRKRGAQAKSRGRKGRRGTYDSDSDDPPAEPWETDAGAVFGNATCWLPEHEFNPPAQDDPIDEETKQLAISSSGIQTQPVRDASFRYAKVLSEGFYNAGIVDLPPGSEKRPKNSRKNFMSFFVHTGRVLVTVNDTSFRITKGGMFFVPRGNYYSIENDYDQPARLFFSQGCEVAPPEPVPVEEGGEEEEEEEEEEER
ncbi:kinetochore CENP-C fungal-like protein [Cercophora newfieldiana]|uniref:CENP-C homolog n=1 Tax=Cercophora newfieldiana TaxID=92897 RepID=A0AA40CTV1_9PEZI|nr:kinetochore CENP-C fungal-like protein [Cercophora newfieldiana]